MQIENLYQYIAVTAGLGTASFALVDASKAFFGGASNYGFGYIKKVMKNFFTESGDGADRSNPLHLEEIIATLRANWLNGTALSDQKAIAKSLIKLRLNQNNAPQLAKATGVDAGILTSIVGKIASGTPLTQQENDVFGRFDLMLTTLLDRGYQRADQSYRNKAKASSIAVSVLLALVGVKLVDGISYSAAILTGLAATPIAPVAKDLTSAIQAGVKAAQIIKK